MFTKPIIPKHVRETLRGNLARGTKKLKFARVSDVKILEGQTSKFYVTPVQDAPLSIKKVPFHNQVNTPEDKAQYVERKAEKFVTYTFAPLTSPGEDKDLKRKSFYSKYLVKPEFDELGNLTFCDDKDILHHVPQPEISRNRPADLICFFDGGFDTKQRQIYHWFICSEQFYTFWKMIHYDRHPSWDVKSKKKVVNPFTYRQWFTSGNRLMVRNDRKRVLACQENGILIPHSELMRWFFVRRSEELGLTHVDTYLAIIMLAIYGEYPNYENVATCAIGTPNEKEAQRNKWDVDSDLLVLLLTRAGMTWRDEEELKLAYALPFAGVPGGTEKLSAKEKVMELNWATDEEEMIVTKTELPDIIKIKQENTQEARERLERLYHREKTSSSGYFAPTKTEATKPNALENFPVTFAVPEKEPVLPGKLSYAETLRSKITPPQERKKALPPFYAMVGNLPSNTTWKNVRDHFSQVANVLYVRMEQGYARVEVKTEYDLQEVLHFDKPLNGKNIFVSLY